VSPGFHSGPSEEALSHKSKKRDTNRGDKEGLPSREKGGSAVGKRLRWLGGCWF
jgi:hypothetical protein